jgi:type I restriction enzyme S subunit
VTENSDIPEGYKVTERGVLPEEWDVVKIIDVVDFTKKPRSLSINPEDMLPFIPMEMIPDNNDSVIRWQEKKNSEISSGTFVFRGDLIVAKITPCFENGKQAILDNLPTDYAYTTTEVWPMHPKENQILIDFLSNYLRNPIVRKELTAKMEGSTNRQRLPREALQNLLIPLPPLPEQHAIAHVLHTVQEAKEKTDAVIAATKALKASMMKHLFMYGPVSLEDAGDVALKETEIGLVPDGWNVAKLEDYCTLIIDCPHSTPHFIETGFLVIRTSNVRDGILVFNPPSYLSKDEYKERIARGEPQENDILFTREAPIGEACLVPPNTRLCLGQRMMLIRPDKSKTNPYFLMRTLYSEKIQNEMHTRGSGVTAKHLNVADVKRLKLPIPPLPLQNQIANILYSIDQKLSAEQSRKEALDTLFATLLHDLMTAKIRVSGTGPAPEKTC